MYLVKHCHSTMVKDVFHFKKCLHPDVETSRNRIEIWKIPNECKSQTTKTAER